MDYIYSELNNKLKSTQAVQYTPTEIDDSSTIIKQTLEDGTLKLHVDTANLVRLISVPQDLDTTDDVKQVFRLVGWNEDTQAFDIQLGPDIVIDHSNSSTDIDKIVINGQEIPVTKDESGQIVLQYLYTDALRSEKLVKTTTESGQISYQKVYIETILDGKDNEPEDD